MRGALSLAAALGMLHGSIAHAAPPAEGEASPAEGQQAAEVDDVDGEGQPDAGEQPVEPDVEDGDLTQVRKLFALGAAKFDLGDCAGAIEAWEEAYQLAPIELRGQLQVPLANAHVCQYAADDILDHMRRAEVLYRDYLGALDAADEETRVETEALLADVHAEIERVEAEAAARERELAEREAQAREQAAREIVEKQLEVLDPYTEQERRRFRRLSGAGGALLVGGASGVGVMTMALALGQRADTLGSQLTAGDPYSEYTRLRDEGRAWNAVAVTTGVVGGAMIVSGAAVLIVALFERERARQTVAESARLRPHLRPQVGGLELRF